MDKRKKELFKEEMQKSEKTNRKIRENTREGRRLREKEEGRKRREKRRQGQQEKKRRKNEERRRSTLRVLPAETRLTVYRRFNIFLRQFFIQPDVLHLSFKTSTYNKSRTKNISSHQPLLF